MAVVDSDMRQQKEGLDGSDQYLVDYASAALVDPNLHTDTRMRLHAALTELVHDAMRKAHEQSVTPEDGEAAKMLEAILVDPNLHADARMRLHEQIPDLVWAADEDAAAHARKPG